MTLRRRFGALERRRPGRAPVPTRVDDRFATLGDAPPRATPPPPAAATPVRDEARFEPPPAPEGLAAALLALLAGTWLQGGLRRLIGTAAALLLAIVLVASGLLGRGCEAASGSYADPEPSPGVRR